MFALAVCWELVTAPLILKMLFLFMSIDFESVSSAFTVYLLSPGPVIRIGPNSGLRGNGLSRNGSIWYYWAMDEGDVAVSV